MTRYALVTPDNTIDRFSDSYRMFDPSVGTKPGWRWLPVMEESPTFDPVLEAAVDRYIVRGDDVVREWSVSRRPLQEQQEAVKSEAQRRIIALTNAPDLGKCMIKQFNALMRATELNDVRLTGSAWSQDEAAEAEMLRSMATAIKVIRDRSNAIEAMEPIPLDFREDAYWGE